MNVADILDEIQACLYRTRKAVLELKSIDDRLNKAAGGKMPSGIKADMDAVCGVASECDDSAYAEALAEIASNRNAVQRMMDCATLAAKMNEECKRLMSRSEKLMERARLQTEGDERNAALALKAKTDDALRVAKARTALAVGRFFEARLWTLNATEKMTGQLMRIFPNGEEALRSACLANDAKDAIGSLHDQDTRIRMGRMTMTTTGKKRVRI